MSALYGTQSNYFCNTSCGKGEKCFMNVVVSYDVSEDKRRTKIHKVLKSYGQWVQYSVFECQLTDTQYAKLRSRLQKLIEPDTDNIRFYFLCACCFGKVERIGGPQPWDESIFFAESRG
jgi:CRISPR-associated protein Cas2